MHAQHPRRHLDRAADTAPARPERRHPVKRGLLGVHEADRGSGEGGGGVSQIVARLSCVERFWKCVDKTPGHGPGGDCWVWTGHFRGGYGRFPDRKKRWHAHRFAWTLANGDIPADHCILHKCDNPPCVNPAHLSAGTALENIQDRQSKRRQAIGEKASKTKLTEAEVREVLASVKNGEPYRSIARRYGINSSSVARIVSGRNWKYLERTA